MKDIKEITKRMKKQLETYNQLYNCSNKYSNHTKYAEYQQLIKEQDSLICALEAMINLSETSSTREEKESNGCKIKKLLSDAIKKSTKLSSLNAVITKVETDRKEYWKSYYKSHKREIQIRQRHYIKDRSTSDWKARNKEHLREYRFKTQKRTDFINKVRHHCFGYSSKKKEFLNELKRCVNITT